MPQLEFTLTQQEYEALIALAREGTKDADGQVIQQKANELDEFLNAIETNNGVTRDGLWVQWQEMDSPLPPTTNFPDVWPPELRWYIELISRRVAKSDVEAVLAARARSPISVLVTKDPGARQGWTPVDDYFQN